MIATLERRASEIFYLHRTLKDDGGREWGRTSSSNARFSILPNICDVHEECGKNLFDPVSNIMESVKCAWNSV